MRKTKIVCTIGPASSDRAVFADMCRAGMNVARLNFSHGTHEEQKAKLDMIRSVREELGLPIAILLDTKGPEYRIRTFRNGKITLNDGDTFTFTTRDIEGDEGIVSVSYKGLAQEMNPGDKILVNNGLVIFEVLGVEGEDIHCRVEVGGELSNRKSMSFPNKVLKQTYLSEQDKADLLFGIENEVDFIAASFVSCKQDVLDLKDFLAANGGEKIDVIAKIENRAGVDNINEICRGLRGHHGRPRRSRRRGPVYRAARHPEAPHHHLPPAWQARHHGDGDARIHDPQPAPHARGNFRRGQRRLRRLERRHAFRRKRRGQIPGAGRGDHGAPSPSETEQHINYEKRFRKSGFQDQQPARRHLPRHVRHGHRHRRQVPSSSVRCPAGRSGWSRASACPMDIIGMATNKTRLVQAGPFVGRASPVLSEQFESIGRPVLPRAARRPADAPRSAKATSVVMTGGITNGTSGNTNLIKVETI